MNTLSSMMYGIDVTEDGGHDPLFIEHCQLETPVPPLHAMYQTSDLGVLYLVTDFIGGKGLDTFLGVSERTGKALDLYVWWSGALDTYEAVFSHGDFYKRNILVKQFREGSNGSQHYKVTSVVD
ncbi:hypothetical protein TrVGV298_004796 [Trichoderma virens]|nr:hypothetical protein TrVGV298_004796 [Trichoderma virens]